MTNQDIINEIRGKIDIVDLVGEYLPLEKKGKNFFGICPFHNDVNPSLSVSREKQIYKCFSCGASGNVFNFVMDYEHLDFRTVLNILGEKAGVSTGDLVVKTRETKYDKFYEIYDFVNKYFQNNLNTPFGQKAREYLAQRQIGEEEIKKFSIGLALSDSKALYKILKEKEYNLVELENLGLITDKNDMFINRIMFPIEDQFGRVVAYSGRIYDKSDSNKYVNTKETIIFKKGECLYNYQGAKEQARKSKFVILTEGFLDVIRLSTIGYDNAVALMGTALTKEQINLLKKTSQNIYLFLDGDEAGINASLSIGEELQKEKLNVKVIPLTNDYDPDTYIIERGKDSFLNLLEEALPFYEFKIQAMKKNINFDNDLELSKYIDSVLKEISLVDDEIRREIMLKKFAKDVELSYNTLEKRLGEYLKTKPVKVKKEAEKPKKNRLSKYDKAAYALIYAMLNSEMAIKKYRKASIQMPSKVLKGLADEIVYYYNKFSEINMADFYSYLYDKNDLLELYEEIIREEYEFVIDESVIEDFIEVIAEYIKRQEIERLKKLIEEEADPIEKAKITDKIRKLRIGE